MAVDARQNSQLAPTETLSAAASLADRPSSARVAVDARKNSQLTLTESLSASEGPTVQSVRGRPTGSRTAALQQLPSRREARRTNHHCDCEPSSHYHAIATSAVALAGLPNNLRARYGAGLVLLSMAADVSTPGGGAYGRRSQTHGMIGSPELAAVQDQASSGINEPSN